MNNLGSTRSIAIDLGGDLPLLGFCRAGPARGQYVLLSPLLEPAPGTLWDVSFSGLVREGDALLDDAFTIDSNSAGDVAFLASLDIEFASEEIARVGIPSLFGRFAAASHNSPDERPGAIPPFGRIASANALEGLLATIAVRVERDDQFATRENVPSLASIDLKSVEPLILALAAYNYTLAVVPSDQGGIAFGADPWAEIRTLL